VDGMTDAVVKLLREHAAGGWQVCAEAADEIERLQRSVEDLRAYAEQDACEIERLQGQVAELLPFALADANLGADLGPHPGGEYDECGDCRWQLDSTALLRRIAAGEFGPPPGDPPPDGTPA
jgi:hypothetical protein